jgi:hypothetical protein
MSRVSAADDIDSIDVNLLFFTDALEHALRSRSFDLDVNTGILGFERLLEAFRERNLHSGVERDHVFLAGGLNHGLADRRRSGPGGFERRWKDDAGGEGR